MSPLCLIEAESFADWQNMQTTISLTTVTDLLFRPIATTNASHLQQNKEAVTKHTPRAGTKRDLVAKARRKEAGEKEMRTSVQIEAK